MRGERVRAVVLALALLLALAAVLGQTSSRASDRHRPLTDFDRDGYEDLAVAAPFEDHEFIYLPTRDAGVVHVLYGSAPDGPAGTEDQIWSQADPAVEDTDEVDDLFGYSLAVGDFDGDGYTDLAVGVPHQHVGGAVDAGAVHLLYGSAAGLAAARNELWHQDRGTVGSTAEPYDNFGRSLAAGDFDGDGRDDLAVGVPYEDWNEQDAGIVQILYGSAAGMTDVGHQLWRQGADGIPDGEEAGDGFGDALTTADFNGDGYTDLAVGVPHENFEEPFPARWDAGAVHVLYGSPLGLSPADNELWHQDAPGTADEAEGDELFGAALTAGDFDGDGWPDLAVGVPGQTVGGDVKAGAVHILYGGWDGLLTKFVDKVLDQDDIPYRLARAEDYFGNELAAADFNGDGYADLAVGAPLTDIGTIVNAGIVGIFYGGAGGPSTADARFITQGSIYEDAYEEDDYFGEVLAAGNFDGDGYADLAIGVPHEDLELEPETLEDAGALQIVYGSTWGLTPTGDQFWHQSALSQETAEADDLFGFALTAIPLLRHRVHLPLVLRSARPSRR